MLLSVGFPDPKERRRPVPAADFGHSSNVILSTFVIRHSFVRPRFFHIAKQLVENFVSGYILVLYEFLSERATSVAFAGVISCLAWRWISLN